MHVNFLGKGQWAGVRRKSGAVQRPKGGLVRRTTAQPGYVIAVLKKEMSPPPLKFTFNPRRYMICLEHSIGSRLKQNYDGHLRTTSTRREERNSCEVG